MKNPKTTEELKVELKNCHDIRHYLSNNQSVFIKTSFREFVEELIRAKELKKSQLVKDSGLDQTYCYQILSGKKNPSRDKLLCLILAMQLNDKEAEMLLYLAEKPALYPRSSRDSIILFALQNKLSVSETDELLYESGLNTLLE